VETRAVRIKLKPGSIERVRAWAEEIMRRKDEAMLTLRDEGVFAELYFLEREADGDYLVSIMTAEDFERASAQARRSPHDIDAFHQKFQRETWESSRSLELLVCLSRMNKPEG
jgi:hypothetical protein